LSGRRARGDPRRAGPRRSAGGLPRSGPRQPPRAALTARPRSRYFSVQTRVTSASPPSRGCGQPLLGSASRTHARTDSGVSPVTETPNERPFHLIEKRRRSSTDRLVSGLAAAVFQQLSSAVSTGVRRALIVLLASLPLTAVEVASMLATAGAGPTGGV